MMCMVLSEWENSRITSDQRKEDAATLAVELSVVTLRNDCFGSLRLCEKIIVKKSQRRCSRKDAETQRETHHLYS